MRSVFIITAIAALFLAAFTSATLAQDRVLQIRSEVYPTLDGSVQNPYVPAGTIKWEETFSDTVAPAGWQVIDNDGSGVAWEFEQQLNYGGGQLVNPHAGQSFWFSSFQNANASGLIDEWLISPQLPMIEAGDSLRFFAGAIGGSFPDSLKVLVSTTNSLPASFTEIAYFKVDGPIGSWNLYSFDLTPFAGSQIYVAVNYYIVDGGPFGNNSDNVWVDHFILEGQGSGMARLQVIHNAADPAAATVDIYVNDALFIDDFDFREATPFVDVPAGVTLNVGVAPGSSTSVNDTLVNIPVVLAAGETYAAIANGVINPANFAPNPDGISTAFQLLVQPMAREAGIGSDVDFYAVHGSTDAPTVDIIARNVGTLLNNVPYTAVSGYLSVPPASYIIDVADSTGSVVVASFAADLSGLGGGAAAVIASGFLDPSANQNGPAFALIAVLPDGTMIELPSVPTFPFARLQVIHNAADPAAATVDIYVNDGLFIDDFDFRKATPFVDVPAGVTLNIGVAPGTSTSVNDTLVNIPVVLAEGETYAAIANGVLDPNAFAPNPDGISTAFQLLVQPMAREAGIGIDVDFYAVHGSTDAPTVDIIARNVGTLLNNVPYTAVSGYLSVPPASYIIDVADSTGSVVVASFAADLSGLGGGAAAVIASGFLDPSANQNGPAFALLAVLADGTVIELPLLNTARLQVIHNAADPAAVAVDIYVEGTLLLDDFAFRTATPFIDVPANTILNIGVAPPNSTSVSDTLKNFVVSFLGGGSYVGVANGVLDPNNFAPNPDGRDIAFTVFGNDDAREAALTSGNVEFAVLHGSTDAPTVDVIARNVATLVDNAAYGDFTGYISVPENDYILDITDASGSTIVASYSAPLATLGLADSALVVFASGFFDPASNQNGPAFGLYAVLPGGGAAIELPAGVVGIDDGTSSVVKEFTLYQNYPNPFNPATTISFALPSAGEVSIKVFNLLGQEVATVVNERFEAGVHKINFEGSQLVSGVYFYRIDAGKFSATKKMILMK